MLTSHIDIPAPPQQVWDILMDKILRPDQYIPGIEEYECKERAPGEIVRTLITETDDVVELIVIQAEESTITSTLVRHSLMEGTLIQRLEAIDGGTRLIIEQNRKITEPSLQGLDMRPAIETALEQIKERVLEKN